MNRRLSTVMGKLFFLPMACLLMVHSALGESNYLDRPEAQEVLDAAVAEGVDRAWAEQVLEAAELFKFFFFF